MLEGWLAPALRRRRLLRTGMAGLAVPAVLLAACGQAGGAGGTGPGSTKKEYVVAPLQAAYGELQTDLRRSQPLGDFLAKATGLPVRVFPPGDYVRSVTGLNDGSLDFAFLPAVLYLRAHDESGVEPLFRTLRLGADGKPTPAFTSIIAARADSGINALSDLKGKSVIATDASDAAGWVLPAAQLKKSGLDLKQDVKVDYGKDGADALVRVLAKKADVAFAARHDLADPAVTKADPDAAKTLKILATIEGAPLEVIAGRKGLDAKALDKFKSAFRDLGDAQKATFTKDGKTQPILGQWGVTGLAETKDGDYAALRDAARSIGVKLK